MSPLDFVGLRRLMEVTRGQPGVTVAVIDGPVALDHPDLAGQRIREIPGNLPSACARVNSAACVHGTFVVGMLAARRHSVASAICPDCTFVLRRIFSEAATANGSVPSAAPADLATAILDVVDAGARIVNLSVGLTQPSTTDERRLEEALNHAARRGVITVVAAGNQGTVGSSALTRHPWVVPVVACDYSGRPVAQSDLGGSIGKRGLSAPGENITGLGSEGNPLTVSGTSAATPFVTGAIALLWSEFPQASAGEVRLAITQSSTPRRALVPPPLRAWSAYQNLAAFRAIA
jgi:subtilisin family serine protease